MKFQLPTAVLSAIAQISVGAASSGVDDLIPLQFNNPSLFPPVKAGLWALPEVEDVNGDGHWDLYVSSPDYVNGCSWYFENRGDGVFKKGVRCPLRRRMPGAAEATWTVEDEDSDGTAIDDERAKRHSRVEPLKVDWDGDGDKDVIVGTFTGNFFFFENVGTDAKPAYAAKRKIFEAESCMVHPVAVDWDHDGLADIVFGDEDGHVSWVRNAGRMENDRPVFESPVLLREEPGDLSLNVLAAPFAVDWDGDGDLDFVCGDSPGYLSLVENLSGPGVESPSWAEPKRFTVNGKNLRMQAGLKGSIQGQHERKFGYTSASVADWDGDGKLDLMAGDITGKVTFFAGKGKGTDLSEGVVLPVAQSWRCRPLMHDFDGDGLLDLFVVDLDGLIACHMRKREDDGSLALGPAEYLLVYADGSPVKVNFRPRGHGGSGRRKFQFADWDGDGRLDIICSAWSADFRRNLRTEGRKTVFAPPKELCSRRLSGHETCPTAVDFAGTGRPDLVIGAEDGRFYLKRNPNAKKGAGL